MMKFPSSNIVCTCSVSTSMPFSPFIPDDQFVTFSLFLLWSLIACSRVPEGSSPIPNSPSPGKGPVSPSRKKKQTQMMSEPHRSNIQVRIVASFLPLNLLCEQTLPVSGWAHGLGKPSFPASHFWEMPQWTGSVLAFFCLWAVTFHQCICWPYGTFWVLAMFKLFGNKPLLSLHPKKWSRSMQWYRTCGLCDAS
jgi:hypothetical protein